MLRLLVSLRTIRRLGLLMAGASFIALAAAGPALADISASSSANGMTVSVSTGTVPEPSADVLVDLPDGMTLKSTSANCVKNPLGGRSTLVAQCNFGQLAPGTSGTAVVGLLAPTPGTYTVDVDGTYQLLLPGGGFEVFDTPVALSVPSRPARPTSRSPAPRTTAHRRWASRSSTPSRSKNNGPQGALGVSFDDRLPASLTSASAGTWSNVGNIVITAIPTATGSVTDTASITMIGPDTQPANNTVSVTLQPK